MNKRNFYFILFLLVIPLVNSQIILVKPPTGYITNVSELNVNHSVFSDTATTALNWYTNSLGSLNDASDTQFNNDGGALTLDSSWLSAFIDISWLKLDQTTPQTIINGIPLLDTTPNGNADLKSFVNKEYVDLAVTSLGASYYMYNETDATGYKTTYLTPSGDAETYIEVADLNNDNYIGGWISASDEAPQKLLKGIYNWFITAEKTTGTKTLRVYWQLIERYSNNSEVVIATSSNSNELDGKESYIVPLQLTEDYIPDSGSRIVGKLYADVSGSGNAPTVRIYYQGETSSRWEIPANSEIFQNIFVPYNGAVQDVDLGSYDLTTTGTGTFGRIEVDTDTIVVDAGNHRVGIGTNMPTKTLDIEGDTRINGDLVISGAVDASLGNFGTTLISSGTITDTSGEIDFNSDDLTTTGAINSGDIYSDDIYSGNIKIGSGEAGVDYTLTFDGEDNDIIIKWNEDADYLDFGKAIWILQDSGTRDPLRIYNSGGKLKTQFNTHGTQSWFMDISGTEVGKLAYTLPTGNIGIAFFNASGTGRSEMLAKQTGGLEFHASTTAGQGGNHLDISPSGEIKMLAVYDDIVGGTNRDLYIDDTGKIGYVSSSRSYKENIKDAENTDWIYDLRVVNFDYKDERFGKNKTGLIAEEVEAVNPKLISYKRNIIYKDKCGWDIDGYKCWKVVDKIEKTNEPETVGYTSPELISTLIKEIQKLNNRINILENRVSLLEKSNK